MNDTPTLHPTRPESTATDAPTPLFGSDADSFVQQLRLASQAHRAGRLDEAIASYLRLLAVRPYHAELHNNLGVALRLAGKLEASVAHHRLSLAADPQNPALHSNLGNALRAANRPDEAVKHHFQSIALNRDYAEGFFNLALCLRDLSRLDEAVGCFSRALTLNPDSRRSRVELAIALLMRGELAPGFAAYEARKRLPETPTPEFPQPAWDGGPLEGRRILLYPEQGLSDVLLFVRFARELKRRGATVIVLCQALLKELLRAVDYVDEVVAEGEALPSFDLHASMVSLPHLCCVDFIALSTEPAYLRAPDDSRIKLGTLDRAKLRVGIYWAAMPGQAQDRQRSVPFSQFLPLAGDPELLVFSLQGGVHQKDIQQFGAGGLVHDVGRGIFDFAEAATALSQLDLLISIDAPVAHLAAAMGIKTWVLLPSAADWRWQLGGESAPWYRSARLFRQSVSGDWSPVFAAVRSELHTLKHQ
ncbi:tetratricopeptide repeat-containing glycosyltransferase family protein [Reyranella sp.]|uniref:tetratricopeptide repeat-containing glycosyltransferase family protein n=1 Tax=Reyranella sp. TaxID=1929291 RepID=UPI00120A9CB2|nr:tetratricopeptide repeat-containing glycosyltransferase family protein [Reyranella sp.]TAJ85831.1 MAG: tetratricopeptide repeat protein [Reyranella sp.]